MNIKVIIGIALPLFIILTFLVFFALDDSLQISYEISQTTIINTSQIENVPILTLILENNGVFEKRHPQQFVYLCETNNYNSQTAIELSAVNQHMYAQDTLYFSEPFYGRERFFVVPANERVEIEYATQRWNFRRNLIDQEERQYDVILSDTRLSPSCLASHEQKAIATIQQLQIVS
ncbi:MAG: hypothetical protein ACMXYF_01300 [Candidatus Woesearchaeota archaeon]